MEGEESLYLCNFLSQMCFLFSFLLVVYLQIVKTSPFSARKSNTNTDTFINLANIHKVHSFWKPLLHSLAEILPNNSILFNKTGLFTGLPFDPLSLFMHYKHVTKLRRKNFLPD